VVKADCPTRLLPMQLGHGIRHYIRPLNPWASQRCASARPAMQALRRPPHLADLFSVFAA
jgi:hypothetical protein